MKKYCYLNGKIISEDKAHIGIDDMGLLRGYGVFDFFRTYNGRSFFLREHLDRLENSASLIGLKVPISKIETDKIIDELMRKNKLEEAFIRIVITGGSSEDGLTCDINRPTIIITTKRIHELPPEIYKKGVKIITFAHQRNHPEAKTIDYITMLKLQNRKNKLNAIEILYTNNGNILEGSTSNFFIFKENKLITPKTNMLGGITRKLVIKLAEKHFKVEERNLKINELKHATEAFLTSTTKEILPVVKIDNTKIGNGKVGENTKQLIKAFKNYTNKF